MSKFAVTVLAITITAVSVHAATIFSDNFNSENGGVANSSTLNYNSFANWTVSPPGPNGTVDLIGNGYFDFYPGNGLYVDLDGSSGSAGTLTSSSLSLGPGSYSFTFNLGGSQRGDTNIVHVSVSGTAVAQTYMVNSSDPLALETISFTLLIPTTVDLVFHNDGGDNIGAILDNVTLSTVPDGGSTAVFLAAGLLTLAALRRRLA
jgi:hypothetical protein